MRPLLLRLRNIASLKGEHLIDFREIQTHAPLFAITGETGSGKSSILNSIALALYGQVYKKNVTQVDVVTLGEKEGQIDFIFQLRGRRYLAEWRAKVRKQNGDPLQKPLIQRFIYPLLGDGFDAPKENPVDSSERLLNLDFDQFCKCIILNQGEFARFLSSSFTERKEILEKFYPGETLEKLGKELRQQMEGLQREKNNTEVELNTLDSGGEDGEELRKKKDVTASTLAQGEDYLKSLDQVDYHYSSMWAYSEKWHENARRGKLLREQLMDETSKCNAAELQRNDALKRLEVLRSEHAEEIPRLQELLKTEESLKHLDRSLEETGGRLTRERSLQEERQVRMAATVAGLEKSEMKISEAIALLQRSVPELKKHKETIEAIIDTYSSFELLSGQVEAALERLRTQETQGKELAKNLAKIDQDLGAFEIPPLEKLRGLEEQRTKAQAQQEEQKKLQYDLEETKKQQSVIEQEIDLRTKKISTIAAALEELSQEVGPLETTLQLQEVMLAAWTCVKHVESTGDLECPVCLTAKPQDKWDELSKKFQTTDLAPLRRKLEEVRRRIVKGEEERKLIEADVERLRREQRSLAEKAEQLTGHQKLVVTSVAQLDEELIRARKDCWEFEKLNLEKKKLGEELPWAREAFVKLKVEFETRSRALGLVKQSLLSHQTTLGMEAEETVSRETVEVLKRDLRNLTVVVDMETQRDKLLQEKIYLEKEVNSAAMVIGNLNTECEGKARNSKELRSFLRTKLGDQSATALMDTANKRVRSAEEELSSLEVALKRIELVLRELKARLVTVEDLHKDIELGYGAELRGMQEKLPDTDEGDLARLKNFALTPGDAPELFVPVKDLLTKERGKSRESCNELRMEFASLRTRIEEWERRQDRIQLLRLTRKDLADKLARQERLYEVLGKDELRTFILSLVEENLIQQTNDELQKLCQGRYEIVHLTRGQRMNPEFYILDKFREGGSRKVSTLSGGETFMVSLAMALALAEMTRGQAEVDSLFIDEGFGTLDQDSLEDVLDMLNQIQTRGLTVGIISHIKQLTNSLAVNLVLSKKNDGTSEVSIRLN